MTDHQRRVIIANFVFRYATKAPYVQSGQSLLGAIEVDRAGRMKCHECGSFEHCLAEHLASHGIRCRDYRLKHGLTHYAKLRLNKNRERTTPRLGRLEGMAINQKSTSPKHHAAHLRSPESRQKAVSARLAKGGNPQLRNLRGVCMEQIKARIYALSRQLQRVPTTGDLRAIKIYAHDARRLLGKEVWLQVLNDCDVYRRSAA